MPSTSQGPNKNSMSSSKGPQTKSGYDTNCVVDMGKKKLEMGIDDQKVKFDLFDTIEHSPDQDDCLKVNKEKNERVLKVGTQSDQDI